MKKAVFPTNGAKTSGCPHKKNLDRDLRPFIIIDPNVKLKL